MEIKNSIILDETDQLLLLHKWETVFLIDKRSSSVLLQEEYVSDPTCGIIDKDNKWAVVAGDHLTVWNEGNTKVVDELADIHSIRTKNTDTIEVLIDPWSTKSSIWKVNVLTLEKSKIRDFLEYRDKPYTEEVNW
ncbi:hypothetical protein [Pontibacter sp. HSC-36F09]|uniref:hypothetical protein n=1 Tax=Pontibacter sp. HSC-36F09 TaxID=2910966 RepID=UPI0020A138D6|nr:hypothetical protein [Pontibacter sp. HSC-36F09]MCP2044982.1 hypothetical protein [Pontibacter sp. HSC-36F09]